MEDSKFIKHCEKVTKEVLAGPDWKKSIWGLTIDNTEGDNSDE